MLMALLDTHCECCVVSVIVCVRVCLRETIVYACKKMSMGVCVFLVYVCVGKTFVSMLGQFQVLMLRRGTE